MPQLYPSQSLFVIYIQSIPNILRKNGLATGCNKYDEHCETCKPQHEHVIDQQLLQYIYYGLQILIGKPPIRSKS